MEERRSGFAGRSLQKSTAERSETDCRRQPAGRGPRQLAFIIHQSKPRAEYSCQVMWMFCLQRSARQAGGTPALSFAGKFGGVNGNWGSERGFADEAGNEKASGAWAREACGLTMMRRGDQLRRRRRRRSMPRPPRRAVVGSGITLTVNVSLPLSTAPRTRSVVERKVRPLPM